MKPALHKDDLELHEAFGVILSTENLSEYTKEIVEIVCKSDLTRISLDSTIQKFHINSLEEIKEELLDVLLTYINIALKDQIISEKESNNVKLLKMFFKIREGAFYNYKYAEIEKILHRQFEHSGATDFHSDKMPPLGRSVPSFWQTCTKLHILS